MVAKPKIMKPTFKIVCARAFGRFEFYSLDLDQKVYRRIDAVPSNEIEGSLHFFFGKPLFLIRNDGNEYIWNPTLSQAIKISSIEIYFDKPLKIFQRMVLKSGNWKSTYFQVNWADFDSAIDPTYDYLDRWASDFMFQVRESNLRQRKKEGME